MSARRTITGHILYTSENPSRHGQERGREYFSITYNEDGSRTLNAHSEIDDAPHVVRDVSLTVQENWLPTDGTVRIAVGGDFVGSGWFSFQEEYVACEVSSSRHGRLSQRFPAPGRTRIFGNHAIASDCWIAASAYPLERGPGVMGPFDALLSSPDHRGATGPMLCRVKQELQFLGEERVLVEAGAFDALHFRLRTYNLPKDAPDFEMWVTPNDYVFLKGRVGGYMKTYYELVRLTGHS